MVNVTMALPPKKIGFFLKKRDKSPSLIAGLSSNKATCF